MVAAVAANWIIELGLDDVIIMTENTDYGIPAAARRTRDLLEAAGVTVEQFNIRIGH